LISSSHQLHPELDRTLESQPAAGRHSRPKGKRIQRRVERTLIGVAVVLATLSAMILGMLIASEDGRAYFPLSPIRIDGNSGFQIGLNGVTSGTGAAGDPYVISAWDIDAGSTAGIYIGNATVHFLISNVYVHTSDAPPFYPGIQLYNVVNGRVNNSALSGNLSACVYIEQSSSIQITHSNMSGRFAYAVYANHVDDLTVSQNDIYKCQNSGITVWNSNNTAVTHNNFIQTRDPAYLAICTNCTIHANQVTGIGSSGFWVAGTDNASITHNNMTNEFRGIFFSGTSYDILVERNTLTDIDYPIISQNAARVVIRDNLVNDSDNAGDWGSYGSYGISLDRIMHSKVWNNTMLHCGVGIYGQTLPEHNTHEISQNNTVNGRPVMYYKNQSNVVVDGQEVGEILLANCSHCTLSNLQIADSDFGLVAAFSDNVTVRNCNLSGNAYSQVYMRTNQDMNFSGSLFSGGIYGILSFNSWGFTSNISLYGCIVTSCQYDGVHFIYATQTTIISSKFSGNGQFGVWLEDCSWGNITLNEFSNNTGGLILDDSMYFKVWHNNFINNTWQAGDSYSNTWDDGYPSGGNYWDNFTVTDVMTGPLQNVPGTDGIGDQPFWLDPNSLDNYPLMQPVPEFGTLVLPVAIVLGMVLMVRARRTRARRLP